MTVLTAEMLKLTQKERALEAALNERRLHRAIGALILRRQLEQSSLLNGRFYNFYDIDTEARLGSDKA